MTDAEINALVAEKVAGWKWRKNLGTAAGYQSVSPMSEAGQTLYGAPHECFADAPSYLSDPAAVFALLDTLPSWECDNFGGGDSKYRVNCWKDSTPDMAQGKASTFTRAAVLALLRAHGVQPIDL